MATDKSNPENLVLEHLRHIRGTVDKTDERLTRVKVRLTGIEKRMATMLAQVKRRQELAD